MRIVVAHSHLHGFGGGERCTLELLRYLGRRHEVMLWAGAYNALATFPELAEFPRRDVFWTGWLLDRPAADVVVTQSFGASLLALHHPRTLCYIHTLRSRYLKGGLRPDLVARRVLDRRTIADAAALITNSAYTSHEIARRYGRDAVLAPPGADSRLFALTECIGTYALYVGRLAREKGVDRLLAWSRTAEIDLMLVGDGEADYVASLRQFAGPRVHFRGPLTGAELEEAYAGARCITFLPYEEEFGLAALEGMAAGKPVIATPEGGIPELIQDGVNGLLVRDGAAFSAAMSTLLHDDEACLRLGRAGRERARPYTWDRFGATIEDLCVRQL